MGARKNLAELMMGLDYSNLGDCGGWKNSPLGVVGLRSSTVDDWLKLDLR